MVSVAWKLARPTIKAALSLPISARSLLVDRTTVFLRSCCMFSLRSWRDYFTRFALWTDDRNAVFVDVPLADARPLWGRTQIRTIVGLSTNGVPHGSVSAVMRADLSGLDCRVVIFAQGALFL